MNSNAAIARMKARLPAKNGMSADMAKGLLPSVEILGKLTLYLTPENVTDSKDGRIVDRSFRMLNQE